MSQLTSELPPLLATTPPERARPEPAAAPDDTAPAFADELANASATSEPAAPPANDGNPAGGENAGEPPVEPPDQRQSANASPQPGDSADALPDDTPVVTAAAAVAATNAAEEVTRPGEPAVTLVAPGDSVDSSTHDDADGADPGGRPAAGGFIDSLEEAAAARAASEDVLAQVAGPELTTAATASAAAGAVVASPGEADSAGEQADASEAAEALSIAAVSNNSDEGGAAANEAAGIAEAEAGATAASGADGGGADGGSPGDAEQSEQRDARPESDGQTPGRPAGADRELAVSTADSPIAAAAGDEQVVEVSLDPKKEPTSGLELSQPIESPTAAEPHAAASNDTQTPLSRIAAGRLTATDAGGADTDTGTPRVDPARFVSRVSRAFQTAQERGGEVRLRLSPPELGALQIKISVNDGALTASLETENAAARNVLLDNLPALRERLAEQEIRIEKFDVDVRDEGGQQDWAPDDRDERPPRERSGRSTAPLPATPTPTEAAEPPTDATDPTNPGAINVVA